jgi:hypothetical protein
MTGLPPGAWYLRSRSPRIAQPGRPFSLLASVVRSGDAPLKPFEVPVDGRLLVLIIDAPGLRVLDDHRRMVLVPPDGDSEPVIFDLIGDDPGPRRISVTAWDGGSYLGELVVEVSVERDASAELEIETISGALREPTHGEGTDSMDPGSSARPLTIAESADLLQTCDRVVSLLTLDEMWSVYLTAAQGSRVAEVDFSGLLELSKRMLDGLSELVETGPRAAELVGSQSDEALIAGLQRLRVQYGPAELFDSLLDNESARTSLREVLLSAWHWILDNVDDERDILRRKRELLSTGNPCDPDFRLRFKCILVVAGLGAGAALAAGHRRCWPPP